MRGLRHALALFVLLLTLAFAGEAHGDPGDAKRATILLKALSFDLDLETRIGDELVIAVVFKRGDAASEATATSWTKSFAQLGNVRVKDVKMRAIQLAFDPAAITEAVQKGGVDVLLAVDGLDADLDSVIKTANANKLITIGAKRAYVEKGLVLGAFVDDDKPKIWVNLGAARQGGFRLSSAMLRLAVLVK